MIASLSRESGCRGVAHRPAARHVLQWTDRAAPSRPCMLSHPEHDDSTYAVSRLRERVKELRCLYRLSEALQDGAALAEQLRGVVQILPPSWQFPELAECRVRIRELVAMTAGFSDVVCRQAADIVVGDGVIGSVEVGYRQRMSEDGEPFLVEEDELIREVARKLGRHVAHVDAETRRGELELQLRHADRLATIGRLAAGLGHELNEPLSAIIGFAQLACKHDALPAGVDDDLQRIVKAGLHARDIVRKLMVFARRVTVNRARVDPEQVIDDALALLAGRLRTGRVAVERRRGNLPLIFADGGQIQQAMMNLLLNAILAMPDGGSIIVATRVAADQGDWVEIEVTDTGCGMPPDTAERIFEPFFTTRDVGEGTGLGLAVSYGIISAHGGTLTVRTAVGAGSTFTIRLPIDVIAGTDDGPREERA